MISRVIDYLKNKPTPTTAPLYLALNTSEIKALMGTVAKGPTDKVTIYGVNAAKMDTPYVKLYPAPQVQSETQFLGGSYQEWQILLLDSVVVAPDEIQAQERSDVLRLEVERVLRSINFASNTGVLADRVSPANANYRDGIRAFNVVSNSPQVVVTGLKTEYKAVSTTRLEILVFHARGRAA
jgi:hypothetical protein